MIMNIIGIGIDLEIISRFRRLLYKKRRHFYSSFLTDPEIKYCLKKSDPYPSFAAIFSAKEAVIKALPKPVLPKDIEIIRKRNKLTALVKTQRGIRIFVSISHTRDYAAAIALAVRQ